MAFSLGASGAALWAGLAVDRFGTLALAGGSTVLAAIALGAAIGWRPAADPAIPPLATETT